MIQILPIFSAEFLMDTQKKSENKQKKKTESSLEYSEIQQEEINKLMKGEN